MSLTERGDHAAAERALQKAVTIQREAIRLRPDDAAAHLGLGLVLCDGAHDYPAAITAFREAIRLEPNPAFYHNLGIALSAQWKQAEAIAAYREAIRLEPDFAMAHFNLGSVLQQQGQFREAMDQFRRGHELGSKQPNGRYHSAEWVRQAEQWAALDARLPAVICGDEKPRDAAESAEFAYMACKTKQFGPSARLHAESFRADANRAEDVQASHRYDAACAAAMAGAGQGDNTPPLDQPEKARWRKQAVDWLRADLAFWAKQAETSQAEALVSQKLRHWKADTDLAGIRD